MPDFQSSVVCTIGYSRVQCDNLSASSQAQLTVSVGSGRCALWGIEFKYETVFVHFATIPTVNTDRDIQV